MNDGVILLNNLDRIHTTKMGIERISKNLQISGDVVDYCVSLLKKDNCKIAKSGKNWYASVDNCIITINSYSYTIITAHLIKK